LGLADERGGETTRITRETISEQLERALRIDILEGILQPGQRLRANELAERYGVSATPLREALQRLAGEKLVSLDARLGATVAPISRRDVRDIYELLQLLDGLALERSIAHGDESWLADLGAAFATLSRAVAARNALSRETDLETRRAVGMRWSAAHWGFHETLYRACGSPWLMRFVRQLHAHADRYQMLTMRWQSHEGRDSLAEHREIYEAARARDVDRAVGALRGHLGLTIRLLMADGLDEPAEDGGKPEGGGERAGGGEPAGG
jgi:GntR family carbon starvation induced transcriptional regulator